MSGPNPPFRDSERRESNLKFWLAIGALNAFVLLVFLHESFRGVRNAVLFDDLLVVFGSFAVSILIFATLYHYLYKINSAYFLFNEAISQRQKEIVGIQAREELVLLAKKIVLVSELLSALVERKAIILTESAPSEVVLPSGVRYSFGQMTGPTGPFPGVLLFVSDESGNTILRDCFIPCNRRPERTAEEFITVARIGIQSFSKLTLELEQRIASLSTESPKLWSILDFIYFSTIIQATVGLGDILPNSTFVRCIVVLQVLFGYGILMVALNMVVSTVR